MLDEPTLVLSYTKVPDHWMLWTRSMAAPVPAVPEECVCECVALQMAERSMISALAVHEYDFVKAKKAKGGQWRWLSGPPDAPLGRLRWTRQGLACPDLTSRPSS